MGSKSTWKALARVMAAAAWADGRMEAEEANTVKSFMLRFRLEGEDAQEIAALLESPVTRSQAESFMQEFLASITTPGDKQLLVDELTAVMSADGHVSPDEADFLDAVFEAVENHSVIDAVFDRIGSLFRKGFGGIAGRRSSMAESLRTRLQDRVREHVSEAETSAAVDPDRLNRAALFGGLLQKVAHADGTSSREEAARIAEILRAQFSFEDAELATIVAALEEQVTRDVDVQRLTSEFNRVADQRARVDVVRALFAVALADGTMSADEVEEARRIADFLWVDRRTFHELRRAALGEAGT